MGCRGQVGGHPFGLLLPWAGPHPPVQRGVIVLHFPHIQHQLEPLKAAPVRGRRSSVAVHILVAQCDAVGLLRLFAPAPPPTPHRMPVPHSSISQLLEPRSSAP